METKIKGTSEAQKAASRRYLAKMRTIRFYMTPEEGKELELHCTKMGESMNAFIRRAIAAQMETDKASKKSPK